MVFAWHVLCVYLVVLSCSIDFDVMSIWTLNARTCILHTYMQVSLRSFLAACVNRYCTSSLECHCSTCKELLCPTQCRWHWVIQWGTRNHSSEAFQECGVWTSCSRNHRWCTTRLEAAVLVSTGSLAGSGMCNLLSVRFELIVCKHTCLFLKPK